MKRNNTQILIFLALCCHIFTTNVFAQDTNVYEKNLSKATDYYLLEKELPDSILLQLVPKNDVEFGLYYDTTGPDHKMNGTSFFYNTTRQIFNKVIKEEKDNFYLPSLRLISFADGEFGEDFIHHLELIIEMDKKKFCNAVKNKDYSNYNPIRFYKEKYKCE